MTTRRMLAGIIVLAVLAGLWIGRPDSSGSSGAASDSLPVNKIVVSGFSEASQAAFSEADLQAGLEAICQKQTPEPIDEDRIQASEQLMASVPERLAASSSAEHLLVAALMETESAAQIDLIERAISAGPDFPLLLWTAVRICSDSRDAPGCPLREWEQRLIAVDAQNSESWMLIARNRYAAGDERAALEAMRFASVAAVSNDYWTESIALIERGLLSVGSFTFAERVTAAIGTAARELPSYGGLTTMCREQSPGNSEWADACLRYGELVEKQGETEISVSIGRSVQQLVLESVGEQDRAAEVEARLDARTQERNSFIRRANAAFELVAQEPSLFYAYLAMIEADGEIVAHRRITTEVERLIRQRPELACQ